MALLPNGVGLVTIGTDSVLPKSVQIAPISATSANTARLLSKLKRGVEDACYLYVSDSTGNEQIEHIYLELQALAARFPAYTVLYYLWNDTTKAYDSPVTVQTGTGSKTLRLFNLAIPGTLPAHFLDSTRWGPGVVNIGYTPDAIFISHGHNMGSVDSENTQQSCRNSLLQFTEEITALYPNAGMVLMSQNPTFVAGREAWQAIKARLWQDVAAQRGYGFIDVHQAFTDTGNPSAYVKTDLVHPTTSADTSSPNGSLLWANTVSAALRYDPRSAAAAARPSAFVEPARTLLVNGDLATWTNLDAAPDGFTKVNATLSKDTTNYETGTYGLRIQGASADGIAGIEWTVNPTTAGIAGYVDGKVITVKARVRVPSNSGTVALIVTDNTGGSNQRRTDLSQYATGKYVWLIATKRITAAPTSLKVQVCARVTGTSGGDVTVDRVEIVEGNLPLAGAYLPTPKSLDAQITALLLDTNSALYQRVQAIAAPVAPTVTTTSLVAATQNTAYSQALAATGTAPITWAVTTGSLPAGLTLSSGGTISGTPTGSGSSTFTVTATNSEGSDTQELTLTVNAAAGAEWTISNSDGFSGDGSTGLYQRTSDAALGGTAQNWAAGSTADRTRCDGVLKAGTNNANTLFALPLSSSSSKVTCKVKQLLTTITTSSTVGRLFCSRSGIGASGQSEIGLTITQAATTQALTIRTYTQDTGGTAVVGTTSVAVNLDDEIGVSIQGSAGAATLRLWVNGTVVQEQTYTGTLPSAYKGLLVGHATDNTWQFEDFKTYALAA